MPEVSTPNLNSSFQIRRASKAATMACVGRIGKAPEGAICIQTPSIRIQPPMGQK